MPYAIYILKCADGSCYTGLTIELDARVGEHQTAAHRAAYTFSRWLPCGYDVSAIIKDHYDH